VTGLVYLSPHLDDVAFSCGGAVHEDARAGREPLVVTVCAAAPAPGAALSAFCREVHAAMGLGADAVAVRREEDCAALRLLGARGHWLDVPDAIYRRDPHRGACLYASDEALVGPLAAADLALVGQVVDALRALAGVQAGTRFLAPLAVGNHVDHQLVHRVGLALRERGHDVCFYEDFPYADPAFAWPTGTSRPRPLEEAIEHLDGRPARARPRPLCAEAVQARVHAILAYASQWPWLFDSADELARRVRAHASAGGGWQERFWA